MKKRIEQQIDGFARTVLIKYRAKDGLTSYAYDSNRIADENRMRETMREELPKLLDRMGVTGYLDSLGEE